MHGRPHLVAASPLLGVLLTEEPDVLVATLDRSLADRRRAAGVGLPPVRLRSVGYRRCRPSRPGHLSADGPPIDRILADLSKKRWPKRDGWKGVGGDTREMRQ